MRKLLAADSARSPKSDQMRANASLNRELVAKQTYVQSFCEGRDGRLSHRSYIPTLEEDNARQGFVDHHPFVSLEPNLAEYLRDPIALVDVSGRRLGEMKALEWRDVDMVARKRLNRCRSGHSYYE